MVSASWLASAYVISDAMVVCCFSSETRYLKVEDCLLTMADQHSKQEEEKLEFTPDAEALGYISLDQATVLAIRNARDDTSEYGKELADRELVWEVDRAEERGRKGCVAGEELRPARGS